MHKHIDPVCHMEVDPEKAEGEAQHEGKKYYFCSHSCRESFEKAPEKYSGRGGDKGRRGGCCSS